MRGDPPGMVQIRQGIHLRSRHPLVLGHPPLKRDDILVHVPELALHNAEHVGTIDIGLSNAGPRPKARLIRVV